MMLATASPIDLTRCNLVLLLLVTESIIIHGRVAHIRQVKLLSNNFGLLFLFRCAKTI